MLWQGIPKSKIPRKAAARKTWFLNMINNPHLLFSNYYPEDKRDFISGGWPAQYDKFTNPDDPDSLTVEFNNFVDENDIYPHDNYLQT